jgi:hypothetical protein
VSVVDPLSPPLVAVTVTEPAVVVARPITSPDDVTVARTGSLDVQTTTGPLNTFRLLSVRMAVSCADPPT